MFRSRWVQILAVVTLLLGVLAFTTSCGDDKPGSAQDAAAQDKGAVDAPSQQDITVDSNPADTQVWPDVGQQDVWPKQDAYNTGAPFGCRTDSDCFGQKCCATPWGVKLCAARCL